MSDPTSLSQLSHASVVLVTASLIEKDLKILLLSHMPQTNNKLENRLFEGPIQSLSAKIDIAYAFGLIDKGLFDRLRFVCDIRNEFAHADEFLSFDYGPMAIQFAKLPIPRDPPLPRHKQFARHMRTLQQDIRKATKVE